MNTMRFIFFQNILTENKNSTNYGSMYPILGERIITTHFLEEKHRYTRLRDTTKYKLYTYTYTHTYIHLYNILI